MRRPIPDGLRRPITNVVEAKAWIDLLVASEMDFHLEDDARTIIQGVDGPPLFFTTNAWIVNERRHELYALPASVWGEHDCPIGYMMAKLDERDGTVDLVKKEETK